MYENNRKKYLYIQTRNLKHDDWITNWGKWDYS